MGGKIRHSFLVRNYLAGADSDLRGFVPASIFGGGYGRRGGRQRRFRWVGNFVHQLPEVGQQGGAVDVQQLLNDVNLLRVRLAGR